MASRQLLAAASLFAQPSPHSNCAVFASAILRLAALFHDIGKATLAFQKKLANGGGAEAIRHDLMSFLVLAESLTVGGCSDRTWLSALAANPARACACITGSTMLPADSEWLARVTMRLASEKGVLLSRTELKQMDDAAPGLLSVLWLVLTHHRLPGGDDLAEQLDAGRHLNIPRDDSPVSIASVTECLTPHPGRAPWQDQDWLAAVANAARDALAALSAVELNAPFSLPRFFWPQLCAHLLRPALVLADHIGSMQADKGPDLKAALAGGEIYANLYNDKRAGDTLARHLRRVETLSSKALELALNATGMPTTTLPPGSLALRTNLPADFRWQEDLGTACAEARMHGPVFASIIAETGAGKTLAGTRAMHAVSGGKMRFTLALGLRSLTWQSAGAMLEDAQLPAKDVTVAVGQPQTLGLDALALANQQGGGRRLGSESAEGAALEAAVSNIEYDCSWLAGVCSAAEAEEYWGKPALALLSAPVVACTVDHLVSAVSLLRGGDAKLFLRLATADLLLDEIDAYSASDLQTIGKLAYVAGLHGRSVVLMSATMSPTIRQGLLSAWHAGLQAHACLHGKPLAFGLVNSANCRDAEVQASPTLNAAGRAWGHFVQSVCRHYAGNALLGRRRQLGVHTLVASTLGDAFAEIEDAALRLHNDHHIRDPRTGKRVSVGFARLNTASNAWRMAEFLAKRTPAPGGPDIRFVAYHSKFPRNYLGVLDATLGQLTRRKSEHAFLDTPALRAVLDTTASDDVVVIVCTTTLIETGRDFDFDWCILEPRSVRGEVQAVGRVRRHRKMALVGSAANVLLLSRPLSTLRPSPAGTWSRPGVEDALPNLRVTPQLPQLIRDLMVIAGAPAAATPSRPVVGRPSRPGVAAVARIAQADDALPVTQWKAALDAQLCLLPTTAYEPNRIGYLEQAVQAVNLTRVGTWRSSLGAPPSLAWYLSSYGPLNARHALETRFRGAEAQTALFVPAAAGVRFLDEASRQLLPAAKAVVLSSPATSALIPDLSLQAEKLARNDPHILGAALRCAPGEASFKNLLWDPLLGFLEKSP